MTATFPVTLTISTNTYSFEAQQVKRTIKNKLIKVQKPLTRGNQTGSNDPETMLVDIKKIEDMVMLIGFIPSQTMGTFKSAIVVFNSLVTDIKRQPGPFTLAYRGITLQVCVDQIEQTDSARVSQSYRDSTGAVVGTDSPQRVELSISFTVGKIRGT
jgi:hypothetical protein